MRLILSPIPEVCTVSYMDMFLYFKTFPEELTSVMMDDFVYNYSFIHRFFVVLNKLHSGCSIQVNSFLQEYTYKKLLECGLDLSIITTTKNVGKYFSGNCYESLYKRLKKEKYQINLVSDFDTIVNSKITVVEMVNVALFLKKLEVTDMGGLSNLIKAASEDLRKKDKSITSESELTEVMKSMGLDLDTGESFMNSPVTPVPDEELVIKEESEVCDSKKSENVKDENDICYKIDGDKMAILIPEDTPIETVIVDGVRFKRLLTAVPDINTKVLQIFPVLNNILEEIVRVPIFLKKSNANTSKTSSAKKTKKVDDLIDSDVTDLEQLKQRKQDLDEKIAEARKDGDENLVTELRKQRRKIRNSINKILV